MIKLHTKRASFLIIIIIIVVAIPGLGNGEKNCMGSEVFLFCHSKDRVDSASARQAACTSDERKRRVGKGTGGTQDREFRVY
jgi:hypothetical protein